MNRQQVFATVYFALLILLLYQIVLMFRPFLFPLLWAALLAHTTFPLHLRLSAFLRGRDTVSAACLTFVVLALVVVPVLLMAGLLVSEASSAEPTIRSWIAGGALQRIPEQVQGLPVVGGLLYKLLGTYLLDPHAMEQLVMSSANWVSRFFLDQVGDLLKNVFLLVTNFFLMLFVLFFLFKDGKEWWASLYALIPMDEAHKQKIVGRLDQTIRAVLKGMFLTALVQGLLAGLAYAVLGIPFPVVLTALTIIVAPIPFGGTALVWGPVVLYLLAVGPVWKSIVMLGWGIGVVSTVDQFFRPWLIGQEVRIPVLFLVLSILGGLALYGVIGLFVGPVLVSLLVTAIQIYREEYYGRDASMPAGSPPSS